MERPVPLSFALLLSVPPSLLISFLLAEVPSFILLLPRATRFFRPRLFFLLVLQLVGKYETAEIEDGLGTGLMEAVCDWV